MADKRIPGFVVTRCVAVLASVLVCSARGETQPSEHQIAQTLADVCLAVECDRPTFRASTTPAAERLARVRTAVDVGLPAIYAALEAPVDPARAATLDQARALATVRAILADASGATPRAPGGTPGAPGPGTLGIPQKAVPHPHPYLLERTLLFPFQQGLVLEAQVAPHLYLFDTLTRESVLFRGGNAFAASVTPMFKVRIRNERSSPVQTLSFMPKVNLQYFRLPGKKDTDPWPKGFWMKGALFVWGHHSNGQVECLYAAGVPDDKEVCIPPARPEDVHVNYPIGSFSTNYLRFAVFGTHMHLGEIQPVAGTEDRFQQIAQAKTTLGATLEVNPPKLPPGGTLDEPARSLYGPTRVGVVAEHEARTTALGKGSYRLTGSAEFINKVKGLGSSRWRFVAEAAFEPDWFRSGGFVARYVHGQDYYNLQFMRDIHSLQFGIVFSASEFEPFLSRLPGHP